MEEKETDLPNEKWTKAKAAQAAIDMQSSSNLMAILREMQEIGRAYMDEGTDAANQSPPMRLAMVQACHLAKIPIDWYITDGPKSIDILPLIEECERIAKGA